MYWSLNTRMKAEVPTLVAMSLVVEVVPPAFPHRSELSVVVAFTAQGWQGVRGGREGKLLLDQTFTEKGQTANIWGFVDLTASVTTTEIKAATDNG